MSFSYVLENNSSDNKTNFPLFAFSLKVLFEQLDILDFNRKILNRHVLNRKV